VLMGYFWETQEETLWPIVPAQTRVFEQQLDLQNYKTKLKSFSFTNFVLMTHVLLVKCVQEKESTGREGVREGETSAGEFGGERTGPMQERIHRYQPSAAVQKLGNFTNVPQRIDVSKKL